jgi:rfaE bifunctional protein kinase chain/domain
MIAPELPSPHIISKCKVLVVGDVMLDRYWKGDVTRISPEAPVPVVHISSEECRLGGAANVALNLRCLGANVTLMSITGKDEAALKLTELLTEQGINYNFTQDLGVETIVKLRIVSRHQQIVRVDFEKKPDVSIVSKMIGQFKSIVEGYDVILFSDYAKGSLANVQEMIHFTRTLGKPIFVDPKGNNWEKYRGASVITPNKIELRQVIGSWSDEAQLQLEVLELNKKLNFEGMLLTRSEEGMTFIENGSIYSVPAMTNEVADVSGAGDTAIATMALMVGCGLGMHEAMVLANRAASLVVAKFGTSSITYTELAG